MPTKLMALALALASGSAIFAQTFTGSIRGSVTDPSGAVVAGALVQAMNTGTGETRSSRTSDVGQYLITSLPPGEYRVVVEFVGFKKFERSPIRVDVLQDVRVDIPIEPGSVTEEIKVSAESPLLETASASLGQVIDNRKIVDLPLNGRNPFALVALTPGVTTGSADAFGGQPVIQNVYAQGDFTVNSGLQSQSESLIDGIPNNSFLWNSPVLVPSVAAVAEFKVQTNNFSAEFGHTGGGIINLITRSGGNQFHATLFEFFRNNNLDANTFFNNRSGQSVPPYTFNQFGGSVGGPVLLPHYNGRNKTFFFFNYDGLRENSGLTVLATVPTPLQRSGNFSQTFTAGGAPVTIYDPATVRATPGVGSGFQRDPFPGNQIPRNRFDPAAAHLLSMWPLPNLTGTDPAQISNYVINPVVDNTQDQWSTRIDHIFSANHRIFGRFSSSSLLPGTADGFNTIPGAGAVTSVGLGGGALLIWSKSFALDHTWIINPSTLLDFRYGLTRQRQFRDPISLGIDLTGLGFAPLYNNQVQIRTLPTIAPSGFTNAGEGGNIFFRRGDNIHSLQLSLTKSLSRHSIKAGLEFRTFLFNDARAPGASGSYAFNAGFTQADPLRAAANAGNSFASFLLGLPASGSVQYFPAVSLKQAYYGGYVQDGIRLTTNLTLNLGLRYDVETPKNERYNRLSRFNPTVASPLSAATGLNLRGGLEFMGVNGVDRGQWSTDLNDVAPRVGFAWRVTPKSVVRGGYGIFYASTVGQGGLVGYGNDGFAVTNAMVTSLDGGITPASYLSNPYPQGLVLPAGSRLGLNSQLGQAIAPWSTSFPNGYTQQYNFSVQRELPLAFLLDAAFVGSRTLEIPIVVPFNQMNPALLSQGNSLLTQVPNPFFGQINSGSLASSTIARQRLLRPYPQFDAINLYTPIGQASYQSFQIRLERRFHGSVGFQLAYTFAKSLTNAGGGVNSPFGFNTPSIQNYYDLRSEKALSPNDVSNRLVFSLQWELPFGKGKTFLQSGPVVVNAIAGGWQLNAIGTMQSGLPLGLTTSVNQTNALGGTSRPNVIADPNLPAAQQSIAQWFNTAAFWQPAAFTFGNVSRTLPSTRGPGLQDFDVSLFKNNRVREWANLQLRFEAFNVVNRANFGLPGTVFGSAQFGVITGTGPARILQVAAKLIF